MAKRRTFQETMDDIQAQSAKTDALIAQLQARLDEMVKADRERAARERAAWGRTWTARFLRWLRG